MKSKFKYLIIIASILIIAIIVTIVIVSVKNSQKLSFLVLEKHYSLTYDETPFFDISIYATSDDNYYVDEANIAKVMIYNDSDTYSVKLVGLTKGKKQTKKDNRTFVEFVLSGNLEVSSDEQIDLPDAKIKLLYQNGDTLDLKLGNMAFLKIRNNTDIQIKKVHAIVADIDNYTTLSAIVLNINARNLPLTINNITPISCSLSINNDYLLLTDELLTLANNTDIKQVFGDSFNNFNQSAKGFKQINLTNDTKTIVIPLIYTTNEFVDNCGLLIAYTLNGIKYEEIINPYILFKTGNNECFIYQYEPTQN